MAKQSRLLHKLESLVGRRVARGGKLRRSLKFILLAALGLILAVAVPLTHLSSAFRDLQVNNIPTLGLSPKREAQATPTGRLRLRLRSARTVTVKERSWTGTLFLRKSLADVGGEVARAATAQELIRLGRDYYQSGKFQKAAEVLQDAAAAYEDLGNLVGQSRALSYLSLAYRQLEKWDEAEAEIAAGLQLLPVTEDIADSERRARALALNARGRLQLARGQAEAAFANWEKAAQDYEQLKDREGSSGARLNQAQALEEMGRYRRSCNILLKVLSLENQTCDSLEDEKKFQSTLDAIRGQGNSILKAGLLRSLGNVLRSVGQLDRSASILLESLEVAEDLDSPEDQSLSQLYLGNTNRALAKREREFGNDLSLHTPAALSHYQEAAKRATSPTTKLLAQLNRLSLLVEREDANTSERIKPLLAPIKTQIQDLPASPTTVKARINLACSLMRCDRLVRGERVETILKSDSKDAKNLLDDAVKEAQDLESWRLESYALGTLGKWYEYAALGQRLEQNQQKQSDRSFWQEAEKNTRLALGLAEESNAKDLAYQWQWQMGRLLRSAGNVEGAIANYEEAVENLEMLRKDLLQIDPDIQFSFRDNVEPVYRDLVSLLLPKGEDPKQENLQESIYYIDSLQLAELENFLQCDLFGDIAVPGGQTRSLDDAKRLLTERVNKFAEHEPNAALIYTIVLPDRIVAIGNIPKADRLLYHEAEIASSKDLTKKVEAAQNKIKLSYFLPGDEELLQFLYQSLVGVFETEFKKSGINTLVFVLDVPLRSIPMGALYDGQEYLVQKYAVTLASSVRVLTTRDFDPNNLKALIAGSTKDRDNFDPLKLVKQQIEQVQNWLVDSKILSDGNFTKNEFRQEIDSSFYNLIHLATHGQFSSDPSQTFIITDDDSKILNEYSIDINEFGELLQAGEPNRSIELLVLSACETADSDKRAVLGLAGVAVKSGAEGTIAPLWKADQISATELMNRFYQNLTDKDKNVKSKAEALRLAQQSMLEDSDDNINIPYHWAPFVLVGY